MTAVTTAIDHDPEWEPPEDSEILQFGVEKKFRDFLYTCFDGLTRLSIRGVWDREDGSKLTQSICKMKIKRGGPNKIPPIPKELLAHAVVARCTEHAEADDVSALVTYKVTAYGNSDELGGNFQKQGSFTVDGRDEEEEYDEEEEETNPPPVPRGNLLTPPKSTNSEPRVLQSALGPAKLKAASPLSQVHDLMQIQLAWTQTILAEMRTSMTQQRIDYSEAMQAQSSNHHSVLSDVRDYLTEQRQDLAHARDEVNKSNGRVVKMSEQMAANAQGQQEATRRGWEAFQAGMQMKMEAIGQNMSWERQIMFMQFDALAKDHKKEEDDRPGWVKEYGPFILAGVGQIMEGLGNPMGEKIQEIAVAAMEDDEEPDSDPEETAVLGVPPQEDVRKHFDKNQLQSMLQLFDSMLTDKQREVLKDSLPPMAWQNWKSALSAKNEMMGKTFLIQFGTHVKQVPGLKEKLKNQMTSEQNELFSDILQIVGKNFTKKTIIDTEASTPPKREPPPPPPAPPAAPKPPGAAAGGHAIPPLDPNAKPRQIRKYAKEHYNLEFPPRTKREIMLDEIKKAKV